MSGEFRKIGCSFNIALDVSCGNHFASHSRKGAAQLSEAKKADGLPSEEKMRAMSMVVIDGGRQ